MFSNLNKPAFGTSTTTPSFGFGNTAAPNQAPFGQSQLFGKPATTGFGAPAPLFGTSTQQPAPSLFGTPTNTFGTSTQQTAFGTTGLFGQQQNATTGNTLFGNASTSAFGQQNKPTGFGFASAATPLFGQQQSQSFQPSTSSGIFGTPNAFGTTTQMGTVVKFNPVTGTDTMAKSGITHSISTKHHCITCMKEYESKSLEELRWEDYQCNRKGPQQQQGGFGSFTAPVSTAPSLFGSSVTDNKPAFGQMSTFAPSSSGFGLTSQANQSSIFGKPATGFGTQTTSSFGFNSGSSTFGNTATVKPFGTTQTQNVFGAATTQPSGFGTSLFGQPIAQTSTTGGFFNKPAQPPFSTQQPMFSFGNPTTTQSSFFQPKPATGFGTFGQTNLNTSTGFGQQSNLFAQPTQNPFNTFAKPAQPLLFGQQQAQPTFGLGTQQPSGSSLFGNTNKPLFGNTNQTNFFSSPANNFMMPQQQQTVGLNTNTDSQLDFHTVVEKIYEPFPRYSFLDDLDLSKPACHNTTNPIALKEIMDKPTIPVSPNNDISKFRVLHNSKLAAVKNPKYSMLEGLQDKPTNNWKGKRLVLNKTFEEAQIQNNLDGQNSNNQEPSLLAKDINQSSIELSSRSGVEINNRKRPEITSTKETIENNSNHIYPSILSFEVDAGFETSQLNATRTITKGIANNRNTSTPTMLEKPEQEESSTLISKEATNSRAVRFNDDSEPNATTDVSHIIESEDSVFDTCGIKLERAEYYTLPSLQEIGKFKNELGACIIKGFTIGRVGYGNIYFPDAVNVANLNLDEIVHIRYREVIVYTDDNNKPPVGEGLNRAAQVTIDRVWPRDSETNQMIKDTSEIIKNNFVERLAAISEQQNAKFVDYRPETGSWVFTVEHFSKYKYFEEADEEATGDAEKSLQNLQITGNEEIRPTEMQQDLEEVPSESVKRGLGGFSHPEQPLEERTSFIRSFTNPHRMSESKSVVIMKSTFFDEESVSDDISSSELAIQHFGISAVQDVTMLQPRKPLIEKPKQYALRSFAQVVPIERSLSVLPNYMDMQVFKGRSFKVGWGRGFTLIALPGLGGVSESGDGSISGNTIMHLEINCISDNTAMLDLESHMKAILKQTTIDVEHEIPLCSLVESSKCLEDFKEIASSDEMCYKDVWDLCLAFWGPRATTPTERNELFSEWLENVSSSYVIRELEPTINTKSAILNNIYQYLTGHQIEAASNLAMEAGFPRLAVLIPACLNNTSHTLVYNQLHSWKESGALNYIQQDLRKIYMLLGGIPVTGDTNVCESLDWKRSLAIHFWYMCPPGILLTAALQAYYDAFSSTGYACRPSPEYYKSTDDSTNDVLYNIMLLFRSGSLPLYNVLNPASYSENLLDSRLSWLLLQIFSALKVGTLSEHVYNFICIGFASQLEHLGFWKWAVFVLLFIKDRSVKYTMIMSILDRNLEHTRSSANIIVEDFLVNDLKISPKWIHTILAQKTALHNNQLETFQHLILANDYGKAHTTAVSYLIPKFIKTRQLDLLTKLLKDLLPGRSIIWQWNTQAGFILDFLEVYHKITNSKDDLNDFDRWNIKSALSTLCLHMKEFPLESPHQAKALAKIGQFISELIMTVYCDFRNDASSKDTAVNLIKELIMPYDYIHNELEKVANK